MPLHVRGFIEFYMNLLNCCISFEQNSEYPTDGKACEQRPPEKICRSLARTPRVDAGMRRGVQPSADPLWACPWPVHAGVQCAAVRPLTLGAFARLKVKGWPQFPSCSQAFPLAPIPSFLGFSLFYFGTLL